MARLTVSLNYGVGVYASGTGKFWLGDSVVYSNRSVGLYGWGSSAAVFSRNYLMQNNGGDTSSQYAGAKSFGDNWCSVAKC